MSPAFLFVVVHTKEDLPPFFTPFFQTWSAGVSQSEALMAASLPFRVQPFLLFSEPAMTLAQVKEIRLSLESAVLSNFLSA